MGTVVSVDVVPGEVSRSEVYLALAAARAWLHKVDAVFSTWKEHSPVSRLRRGEISVGDTPPEVREVLRLCEEARTASNGWFDPWAIPGGVDPTGLVKGWAARRALNLLVDSGVTASMVNAGGDIAVAGRPYGDDGPTWRIGIRDPWDQRRIIATVEVAAGLATSGTYERGEHVIDPFSGLPTSHVVSASVTGPDLAMADALATALVAGGETAVKSVVALTGYEALVIHSDSTATMTDGFPLISRRPSDLPAK